MIKIHSYTALHYGADYLPFALRSVFPFVDKAHIFYTPTPSHGHTTKFNPIETEEQLKEAAYQFDFNGQIVWHNQTGIRHEGNQRDNAVETLEQAGADIIIVLDSDEVWELSVLDKALWMVQHNAKRNWLINFTHLWRSFNHCCRDEGWPVRFIDLRQENNSQSIGYIPKDIGEIFHFGYAVIDKVMHYKWAIHGHKNELRPNWLNSQWQQKPPVLDCHPTNEKGFWNTEKFDKDMLPYFMREHPFWHLDRIE